MLSQDLDILKELRSLMENSSVVKVIHDCRQDSAALFYQLQIRLDNVFDTQVQALLTHQLHKTITELGACVSSQTCTIKKRHS
jgi:ribonuclease D